MRRIVIFSFVLSITGVSTPAIAQHIDTTWTAPQSADDLKNPYINDVSAVKAGAKIFDKMCVVCHGKKGQGDGIASVTLDPRPTDFLAIRVKKESDGAIFWKMREGKPPMASYKTLLSEEQCWQLVNFIRNLETTKK